MPALVARQWHVLRAVAPAIGALPLLVRPLLRPAARALQLRRYATGKPLIIDKPNSGIIIPSSIANTQPQDVIEHIRPVEISPAIKYRAAVFFVTPAFATWILDENTFVKKALEKLYHPLLTRPKSPYLKFHVLAAVVDRLPTPQAIHNADPVRESALSRALEPPVSDFGHEGIAWATMHLSDLEMSAGQHTSEDKGILSLVTSSGQDDGGWYQDVLEIPLANTIFQTGSSSTMKYSTWIKNKDTGALKLGTNSDLKRLSIRLHKPSDSRHSVSSVAIPLIPLTQPRKVVESMGNILRRVVGVGDETEAASQELEKIVPQYFDARGEPQQAVSVWALLIPEHLSNRVALQTQDILEESREGAALSEGGSTVKTWQSLWAKTPATWNDLVPSAIAGGARLHRVLSGGGGWGKKAGLLSLDPSFYSDESSSAEIDLFATDPMTGPSDFSSAIHEIVRPGDSIQFFASPSGHKVTEQADSMNLDRLASSPQPLWSWEFGMIPSTIDATENSSWQHNNVDSGKAFVFQNSFGALTEGGMNMKRYFRVDDQHEWGVTGGTSVDVPHTRFCSANLVERAAADEGEESKQISAEAGAHHSERVFIRRVYTAAPPSYGHEGTEESLQSPLPLRSFSKENQFAYAQSESLSVLRKTRRLSLELEDVLSLMLRDHSLRIPRLQAYIFEQNKQIRNVIKSFDLEVSELIARLSTLQQDAWDIIDAVYISNEQELQEITQDQDRIARFATRLNASARAIYLLHVSLRWRLSSMIIRRRIKYNNRTKMYMSLERRLMELRAFDTALFVSSKNAQIEPGRVQRELEKLESRSQIFQIVGTDRFVLRNKGLIKKAHKSFIAEKRSRRKLLRPLVQRKYERSLIDDMAQPGVEPSTHTGEDSIGRRGTAASEEDRQKKSERKRIIGAVSGWLR